MIRTLLLLGLCCLTASCQRAPAVETVDVLVAAEDIPLGTKLANTSLRTARYVRGDEPSEAVIDSTALVGRVTMRPLMKDQPVKEADLAGEGGHPGFRYCVLTLVNHAGRNGGFMLPGSRVDFLEMIQPSEEPRRTEIVILDVEVLAVGMTPEPSYLDMMTVAVPEEHAARLTAASREGRLYGVLRRSDHAPRPGG